MSGCVDYASVWQDARISRIVCLLYEHHHTVHALVEVYITIRAIEMQFSSVFVEVS